MERRKFLKNSGLGGAAILGSSLVAACQEKETDVGSLAAKVAEGPIVIATWDVPNATAKAYEILKGNGTALDAVEQGVMVEEADVTQPICWQGRQARQGWQCNPGRLHHG